MTSNCSVKKYINCVLQAKEWTSRLAPELENPQEKFIFNLLSGEGREGGEDQKKWMDADQLMHE
jgi:hypothetical protein